MSNRFPDDFTLSDILQAYELGQYNELETYDLLISRVAREPDLLEYLQRIPIEMRPGLVRAIDEFPWLHTAVYLGGAYEGLPDELLIALRAAVHKDGYLTTPNSET